MDQPLNLGILGAGGIAALSHLPELAEVDGLRVTHMCGLEEDRLQLLCERFSVPRYSMTWEELLGPHVGEDAEIREASYFGQVRKGRKVTDQPFTIIEFLKLTEPARVMLVHYSGGEDLKHYDAPLLDRAGLREWSAGTLQEAGIPAEVLVPGAGAVIPL